MAIIKLERNELDINENDLILDNGSCYIIITKKVGTDQNSYHPIISKTDYKDLKIHGMIYTNNELRRVACEQEKSTNVTYWKFNMELINEYYR